VNLSLMSLLQSIFTSGTFASLHCLLIRLFVDVMQGRSSCILYKIISPDIFNVFVLLKTSTPPISSLAEGIRNSEAVIHYEGHFLGRYIVPSSPWGRGLSSLFSNSLETHTLTGQINLGTAAPFGVLSLASITNTGPTIIDGSIGTAGTSITGFPPGTFSGSELTGSQITTQLNDAQTAYNTLVGLGGATPLTGDLGGMTLAPGTYSFSQGAALTTTLTLAGTGSSSDAWYFQIGTTLITGTNSIVTFTGGGLACNVYWGVGSSATLGTASQFAGNILAVASITLVTSAISDGGLFALGGSVTLDTNNVNVETCAAAASSTLSSTSTSSSTSLSSSTSQVGGSGGGGAGTSTTFSTSTTGVQTGSANSQTQSDSTAQGSTTSSTSVSLTQSSTSLSSTLSSSTRYVETKLLASFSNIWCQFEDCKDPGIE